MRYALIVAAAILMSGNVYAQTTQPAEGEGNVTQRGGLAPSKEESKTLFSIEGTLDYKTAYYFRAYKLMNDSVFQPDITISLREFEVGEVGITPYLNLWNTFSVQEGASGFKNWTETGVNPGVQFTYKRFTLDCLYYATFLPSGTGEELERRGAIGQSQELDITLSYDDAKADPETGDGPILKKIGPFEYSVGQITPIALQPHVLYVNEFEDRADNDLNQYLEFGIEPALTLGEKLSFSFPTVLGCSLDGYYVGGDGHNDFFGYLGTGFHAKYQLTEHWDIHSGVDYVYNLSGGISDYNADYSGDGSRHSWIGFIGVGFSY